MPGLVGLVLGVVAGLLLDARSGRARPVKLGCPVELDPGEVGGPVA